MNKCKTKFLKGKSRVEKGRKREGSQGGKRRKKVRVVGGGGGAWRREGDRGLEGAVRGLE